MTSQDEPTVGSGVALCGDPAPLNWLERTRQRQVHGCDAGHGDALRGGNHHGTGCYRLQIVKRPNHSDVGESRKSPL